MSAPQPHEGEQQLSREVVAALFYEHEDELLRLLFGVLRDRQTAADVLQVTFTKVVTQGHTAGKESRKAWLFRVAYHEALAVLRRNKTDGNAIRRLAWSRSAVAEPAEAGLVRDETIAKVREVIESLPPDQRLIVRMRIYEEKTFAVIAEELNIPLGTALGRMRAALEKMRQRLEEP